MMRDKMPSGGLSVLNALENAGFETYFVGGCVRDTLMGRTPQDFDLCTAALPGEMRQALDRFRLLETGLKHGTLTVLTHDGQYEVTTFRTEAGYSDMRHPDAVTFVRSLEEDLKRRDFTVNAMAWSPVRGLRDLFGGQADLSAGVLRCVGEPEARFREDALRILRAMRFGAKLHFSIHPDTASAMERLAENLRFVSAERRFSELCGLFSHEFSPEYLASYPNVLQNAIPGISAHALQNASAVAALPPVPEVRFAALLMGEAGEELLAGLRCSRAFRDTVLLLLRECRSPIPQTGREMRHLLHRLKDADPEPLFALWAVLQPERVGDVRRLWAGEKDACVSVRQLAVKGSDLAALGIPSGPETGALLSALLTAVMDGACENTREMLLEYAENRL